MLVFSTYMLTFTPMQAASKTVSFYFVKDGKETYITTINEAGEQNLRNFYEKRGEGRFIKVVPEYTEEEKAEMEAKRKALFEKMEAAKKQPVADTVTPTPVVPQPKKRGRQPKATSTK